MHCPVCETPIMKAPGYGFYCPRLECDWHIDCSPEEGRLIVNYELERRARDGPVVFGMPQAEWERLCVLARLADEKRHGRNCRAWAGRQISVVVFLNTRYHFAEA
jgi:hypothetical protein